MFQLLLVTRYPLLQDLYTLISLVTIDLTKYTVTLSLVTIDFLLYY